MAVGRRIIRLRRRLAGEKQNQPPRNWSALYQQRPAPEEGDYFKAEWLRSYDIPPPREQMRLYGGSDYAVTSAGGDYTCHVVCGLDPDGNMYLLDLWRRQASADVWIESFCDLVKQWRPIGWATETGQINAGVGPFLQRRMRERRRWTLRRDVPDPARQVSAGAEHPRTHGAQGPLRPATSTMDRRFAQ